MSDVECPLRAAAASDPHLIALEAPDHRLTFRELDEWVEGTASQLRELGGGRATMQKHVDGGAPGGETTGTPQRRRTVGDATEQRQRGGAAAPRQDMRASGGTAAPQQDVHESGGAAAVWRHVHEGGGPVALWMENDWRMVVLLLAALRAGVVICPLSTRLPSVDEVLDHIGARTLISDGAGTSPDDLMKRSTGGGSIYHPPEQPATIVFTSGSSGRPKAALLSVGNHYYNALGSNSNIAVASGDRWLMSLPLYHVGGIAILFRCLLGRGTIVLQGERDLTQAASQVTHLSLVSTQLLRLIRADVRCPNLKAILLGGSAMPTALIESAVDRGLPIHTSYGMTEMASQVTATPAGASREVLTTSGRILPHRDLRVTTEGEILVRGRTRFMGHVEGRELIEPFDDGGWYGTGDIGFLDEGLLRVMGRVDNMFISGGENVMPEEIEQVLTTRPDIRRAVVVPVEDEEYGRRPVAFIEMGENTPIPAEIGDWMGERLPRFKIPIHFFPWPEGELGSGMKLDRDIFEHQADILMNE